MTSRRVLIIDDDTSILRFFTLILKTKGHSIDTAETGRDALEKLRSQSYDVALVDVILPDMNGLDLLKAIPTGTKKIVITGSPLENHAQTQRCEADEFLLKPVKPEKLLQVVAESPIS